MSEVQSRPSAPRGRGSARGGRGGFAARGRRGHATNGEKAEHPVAASIEDAGEVGQLKKQYGSKVTTIQELFPSWTDEDVVFALQETDGDLESTVERITDGTISQWGEVSKAKKDRARSKVKETITTTLGDVTNNGNSARVSRGGRTGFDSGRGVRGRGTDRGRGGRGRGASVAHTNGTRKEHSENSIPTEESSAWDTVKQEDTASWDNAKVSEDSWRAAASSTANAAPKATSSIIPDGVKKSWASMFAPVPTPKKAPAPVEKLVEPTKPEEPTEPPTAEIDTAVPETPTEPIEPAPEDTAFEPEVAIMASKDEITETNLEQILNSSNAAPTTTAESTSASSWDPRSGASGPTQYSALQQGQPQATRPPTSGFAASALKATNTSGRTASYGRRVLDQEEAVRMPGNREVDRAAVQFGAFNLNGTGDEDVDGDREEPETRAQPPQHSPIAHPRASLPPAPQQPSIPDTLPTPKQSASLPAASHPTVAPGLPSPPALPSAQSASQQGPQGNGQFGQYGRFGQGGAQEQSPLPQKPYDAFSQQAPSTQSPFDGYQNQQVQSQQQPQAGAFSSSPSEFSSYYTADPQQRNAYNSYYQQQYAQQQGAQQDASVPQQQRSYSGYNAPQAESSSQFPPNSAQQTQSRYAAAGEGQTSGHTTPNPATQTQQQATQVAQPQPGQPQPQGASYPYGHPYYSSPYYTAYMNQYQQYGGGNYGGGPYGVKGGLHQPYQGYGMAPGAPYEHASSPAAGGFGGSSLHGRDSALGGGLGDYGRAGSAQSSQNPQGLGGSGAFGGVHDAFGRGTSYQGQSQQHYNSQGNQPGAGDDLKPFGESKTTNGPSPSLSQAGRPGSATNTVPGSVLPPPQSTQQGGYGGYPAHIQQGLHGNQVGSQYAGLGAGGHQASGQGHQNSQYGGYQAFGGNYYGNSQRGGGWGGNYGH